MCWMSQSSQCLGSFVPLAINQDQSWDQNFWYQHSKNFKSNRFHSRFQSWNMWNQCQSQHFHRPVKMHSLLWTYYHPPSEGKAKCKFWAKEVAITGGNTSGLKKHRWRSIPSHGRSSCRSRRRRTRWRWWPTRDLLMRRSATSCQQSSLPLCPLDSPPTYGPVSLRLFVFILTL